MRQALIRRLAQKASTGAELGFNGGVTLTGNNSLNKEALLSEAIDEALASFGGSVKKTVIWYLNGRGLYIRRKDFDLRELANALDALIGAGTDVFFNEVYLALEKRVTSAPILPALDPNSNPSGSLERIENLLFNGEMHK